MTWGEDVRKFLRDVAAQVVAGVILAFVMFGILLVLRELFGITLSLIIPIAILFIVVWILIVQKRIFWIF